MPIRTIEQRVLLEQADQQARLAISRELEHVREMSGRHIGIARSNQAY